MTPSILWAEVDGQDPALVRVLANAVLSQLTLSSLQACLTLSDRTIVSAEWLNAYLLLTISAPYVAGDSPTLSLTQPSVDPLRSIDGITLPNQALSVTNKIGGGVQAVTIVDSQTGFFTVSPGIYATTVQGAMALTNKVIPGGCSGWVQCDWASTTNRGSIIGFSSSYSLDTAALIDFRTLTSDNSPFLIHYAQSSATTTPVTSYGTSVGTLDTACRLRRDVTTRRITVDTFTSGVWVARGNIPNYYDGDLFVVVGHNLVSPKQLRNPSVSGAV